VLAQYTEIPYDYLLIATGPRADGVAIPGVAGLLGATESLWSERTAVEAGHALERFLEQPGSAVIGVAQGTTYQSGAYEFALQLDYALRRRGLRERAPLTFVTPEPYLGHLDVGAPAARRVLERLFARRHITTLTGATIERVDREGVHLRDGQTLPAAYTMLMPPFSGVVSVWQSPDLTDAHGFVPVDAQYRHVRYPEIYAVGVAASSPATAGAPKTGYLAAAAARVTAQNIAAVIMGSAPAARALPRLLDLRILDGGDTGVLLLSADLERPLRLALPLPGRTAHWLKRLLTRYLLWKLHTGRTHWP
jgi:sulfide:quinone oxidoreductase